MKTRTLTAAAATLTLGGLAYATFAPRFQEAPVALDQHTYVQEGVGHWTGTMTMNIPGMPEPMTSECSEHVRALGEFWTVSDFEMSFMGMEFNGHNTFGYDPSKEAYVGTWIDNMSTYLTVMEGGLNERTGNLEMTYQMPDEMTGDMKDVKQVIERGEDTYTMTFFDVTPDGDVQTMQMNMQRKGTTEAGAGRGERGGERGERGGRGN